MSREIKFRSWLKLENKMLYHFTFLINGIVSEDKIHSIMQYTGLKDKNSKEIYEGDIVNIINGSVDEEDGYLLVEYENETARFILSGNGLVYDFDNTYTYECEIVGNIYENPELLEGNSNE